MPFAPVFAVAAPLLGILALLVAACFPLLRPWRWLVVSTSAGLSLLGVLFVPLESVQASVFSRWQPSVFFGTPPALLAPPEMWPLAVALAGAVAGSVLVQQSRVPQPRFPLSLAALGVLAAGLAGLWGENLLTVLMAWGTLDLAWAAGGLAAGFPVRRVAMGVGLNSLATLTLWAGILFVERQAGGVSWQIANPVGMGGDLLAVAALLRLGVYPFHFALPAEGEQGPAGAAPLLLGPFLGWGLLARLARLQGGWPIAWPWLETVAVATWVGGGLLALTRPGAGGGWPWTALAAVGSLLWGSLRAGEQSPAVLVLGGAAWTLGVALLHLAPGTRRASRSSVPWLAGGGTAAGALGGLALLGAPLTPGLAASAALIGSLAASLTWPETLVYLLGQALLTGAVARRVLRPAQEEEWPGALYDAAQAAGLILPVALLLTGGVCPVPTVPAPGLAPLVRWLVQPGPAGWGLWAGGTLVGIALFRIQHRFGQRLEQALGLLHDLIRLEWVFRLALNSLDRGIAFLGAVADVIEGPGAILWALAIFFLILVTMAGR